MGYDAKKYAAHPGRNPEHRLGQGRDRWKQQVPDVRFARSWIGGTMSSASLVPMVEVTMLGPKNPNRWLPHHGERERARHRRQIAKTRAKHGAFVMLAE